MVDEPHDPDMTPHSLETLVEDIVSTLFRDGVLPRIDGGLEGPSGSADHGAVASAITDAVLERLADGGQGASQTTRLLAGDDEDDALAPIADALAERLAAIGDMSELPLEKIAI